MTSAPFGPTLGSSRCVEAFRLLRSRAVGAGASGAAQCGTDQTLIRHLSCLCRKAKIRQHDPGRNRQLFTAHSTRVAAVCHLLKAGLSETVVSVLAHWLSQQVRRYGNRLILDPGLVQAFAFYNLVGLAGELGWHSPMLTRQAEEEAVRVPWGAVRVIRQGFTIKVCWAGPG